MADLRQRLLADLEQFAVPRHARWDPLGLLGVREAVRQRLWSMGPLEEHHFGNGSDAGTNLILRLPGREPQRRPLLVGSHYDGPLHSHGADDNASGLVANAGAGLLLPGLARAMGRHVPTKVLPVPNGGRDIPDVRLSDHSPFWDQGYDALMVTDTSFMRNPHYHQMSDTVETLDLAFFCGVVEGLAGALGEL